MSENSPEAISDIDLMEAVKSGDHRAFETLVRRHQRSVYGTVCKMLGDETEAHDITQQAFVRIFRAAKSYRPEAKFTTWMFTIVRNLVFNEFRRRQKHSHSSLDAPAAHGDTSEPTQFPMPGGATPATDLLQIELEREIQSALDALPEQQRLAMVLLRYEDMSYEDIAGVLKTTVPAVKSLIFRAREVLRGKLKKYLAATNVESES